jgi:hypothetical protein
VLLLLLLLLSMAAAVSPLPLAASRARRRGSAFWPLLSWHTLLSWRAAPQHGS